MFKILGYVCTSVLCDAHGVLHINLQKHLVTAFAGDKKRLSSSSLEPLQQILYSKI